MNSLSQGVTGHKIIVVRYSLLGEPDWVEFYLIAIYRASNPQSSHYIKSSGTQRGNTYTHVARYGKTRGKLRIYVELRKATNPLLHGAAYSTKATSLQRLSVMQLYCAPPIVHGYSAESWMSGNLSFWEVWITQIYWIHYFGWAVSNGLTIIIPVVENWWRTPPLQSSSHAKKVSVIDVWK